MSEHTKEPWFYGGDGCVMKSYEDHSEHISTGPTAANARRIVACVNACAGLDDPEFVIRSMKQRIESISFGASAITLAGLEQQRDKLLTALKEISNTDAYPDDFAGRVLKIARAAIAEIEAAK